MQGKSIEANNSYSHSLKLKRPLIAKAYADIIAQLYEEAAAQEPTKGKL